MKNLNLFLFEGKHFLRSPFKVVALTLFAVAAIYGLHNGAHLYHEQSDEIARIQEKVVEERQEIMAFYERGERGPKETPWVNLQSPFWALWKSNAYHFKTPSPAMVYSIGQAEQYGFYKQVETWSSPYDADMTQEIANPERLQTGTLDFSFAVLYLLPLLLLILLYNLGPFEAEQGFLPLIQVQEASISKWVGTRVLFYASLVGGLILLLIFYGAFLTNAFATSGTAIVQMLAYSLVYLLAWSLLYFFLLRRSRTIMGSSLKMIGIWLLFAFVLPAAIHQWVGIVKPANLMTELIDVQRDETDGLYEQPDSLTRQQVAELYPQITETPLYGDSSRQGEATSRSIAALANEMVKEVIVSIEEDNHAKNELVQNTFWINPIAFFQNRLNHIAGTHYEDYLQYRTEIQTKVDQRVRVLILDTWNEIVVDKEVYQAYTNI